MPRATAPGIGAAAPAAPARPRLIPTGPGGTPARGRAGGTEESRYSNIRNI